MKSAEYYDNKLREIRTSYELIMDQSKVSFSLFNNDKKNKEYEKNYRKDNEDLMNIRDDLEKLYRELKSNNFKLKEKNFISKIEKDEKKYIYRKLHRKNSGYDDTDNAIIEMKQDFKEEQTKEINNTIDLTLGIILVLFLIYKSNQ